jgi:hypothetical protein
MKRKFLIITGMVGSGKTRLVRYLVNNCSRVIILDPMCEYTRHGRVYTDARSVVQFFAQAKDHEDFCIVCQGFSDDDKKYLFELVWTIGNVLFVMEESQYYLETKGLESNEYLANIVRRGRHRSINIIAVSQRVPDFHPDVRAQCTSFVTFKQMEAVDLKYLEKRDINPEKVLSLTPFTTPEKLPTIDIHYCLSGETIDESKKFLENKENLFDDERFFDDFFL